MGVVGQRHVPAALPPRKNSGNNFRGGGVCPRAGFDGYGEEKISLRTPDRPSHSESLYWFARKKKFEKHWSKVLARRREGLRTILNWVRSACILLWLSYMLDDQRIVVRFPSIVDILFSTASVLSGEEKMPPHVFLNSPSDWAEWRASSRHLWSSLYFHVVGGRVASQPRVKVTVVKGKVNSCRETNTVQPIASARYRLLCLLTKEAGTCATIVK